MYLSYEHANHQRKRTWLSKFFNWTVAWLPLLIVYGTFIDGISFGDLMLIICLFFALIYSINNTQVIENGHLLRKPYRQLIIFYLYTIMLLLFSVMLNSTVDALSLTKRSIKFLIIVLTCVVCVPRLFSFELFIKYYRILVVVAISVLILQYLLYYTTGYYLLIKIPLIPYSNDLVDAVDYSGLMNYRFRPQSIFLEPSQYAAAIVPYLAITLFTNENNWKKITRCVVVSICLVLSSSSTALILVMIVWLFYILDLVFSKRNVKRKSSYTLLITIAFMALIIIIMNNNILSYSLTRLTNPTGVDVASLDRLSMGALIYDNLSLINKIFGEGFGGRIEYMNSIYYLAIGTGYIGTLIFFLWLVRSYVRDDKTGRAIVICITALMFSSRIVASVHLIVYATLIGVFQQSPRVKVKYGI